jgi:hypothetical protein
VVAAPAAPAPAPAPAGGGGGQEDDDDDDDDERQQQAVVSIQRRARGIAARKESAVGSAGSAKESAAYNEMQEREDLQEKFVTKQELLLEKLLRNEELQVEATAAQEYQEHQISQEQEQRELREGVEEARYKITAQLLKEKVQYEIPAAQLLLQQEPRPHTAAELELARKRALGRPWHKEVTAGAPAINDDPFNVGAGLRLRLPVCPPFDVREGAAASIDGGAGEESSRKHWEPAESYSGPSGSYSGPTGSYNGPTDSYNGDYRSGHSGSYSDSDSNSNRKSYSAKNEMRDSYYGGEEDVEEKEEEEWRQKRSRREKDRQQARTHRAHTQQEAKEDAPPVRKSRPQPLSKGGGCTASSGGPKSSIFGEGVRDLIYDMKRKMDRLALAQSPRHSGRPLQPHSPRERAVLPTGRQELMVAQGKEGGLTVEEVIAYKQKVALGAFRSSQLDQ